MTSGGRAVGFSSTAAGVTSASRFSCFHDSDGSASVAWIRSNRSPDCQRSRMALAWRTESRCFCSAGETAWWDNTESQVGQRCLPVAATASAWTSDWQRSHHITGQNPFRRNHISFRPPTGPQSVADSGRRSSGNCRVLPVGLREQQDQSVLTSPGTAEPLPSADCSGRNCRGGLRSDARPE